MRTQFSKLALAATFGLALALTFSCSSDKEDDGNNNGNGGGGGGSIVNADNEAWVECYENGNCFGAIFKQNGEYIEASNNGGNWHRIDCEGIKTYSIISGNQITFCDQENYCDVLPYSISGNTLTIIEGGVYTYTLTRTSGVYISGDCE
jgi:hypothetical protein